MARLGGWKSRYTGYTGKSEGAGMEEWSVKVEGCHPGEAEAWFEADELELVGEALAEHYAAVGGGSTLEARITVSGETAAEAFARALAVYEEAVERALGKEIEVVGAEMMTAERLEAELSELDDREVLLGVAEAAEFLGVSKTRVGNLREQNYFPRPVQELASGPIWRRLDLKRFEQGWGRRSGPKTARTLKEARDGLEKGLGEAAEAARLPKDVMLKLERGRIATETLPEKLLGRLGEFLDRSIERIRELAAGSGGQPRAVHYKAKGAPSENPETPEPFEEALRRSPNLDEDQRKEYLSGEARPDEEGSG